ncbi:MAG TPA: hypothetical protein VHO68_13765, partial [Bacteroidales bacterium]|nr:hypothetical protein [Bacteroidales bacterium]
KAGINIIGGAVIKMNRVLSIEPYAGVGVRIRRNSYFNVENLTSGNNWLDSLTYYYKEGDHRSYNLTYGIRLCFMF